MRVTVTLIIAVIVVLSGVEVRVIGAPFGFERRIRHLDVKAHAACHVIEHVIVKVSKPAVPDLQGHMAIAKMKGRPGQQVRASRIQRCNEFQSCDHLDNPAVAGQQQIAPAQNLSARKNHPHFHAAREPRTEAAAAPEAEGQHDAVVRRSLLVQALPNHEHGGGAGVQNKKYRCASGSTCAGSQVSS